MTRTGYNIVALAAIAGAVIIAVLDADIDLAKGLVLLAGTVVGRGDKS